jgi:DNA polymerase elongation subunit (family B)
MDSNKELIVENFIKGTTGPRPVSKIIETIEQHNLAVSANGCMFRTDKESTLSTILSKWFDERVDYKNKMKEAYKAGDTEKGEYYHLMQYTMKILLNSLYGATALPQFRYGMNYSILSEAITLSGHRIIQESALCANRHMNKVMRNELKLEI